MLLTFYQLPITLLRIPFVSAIPPGVTAYRRFAVAGYVVEVELYMYTINIIEYEHNVLHCVWIQYLGSTNG